MQQNKLQLIWIVENCSQSAYILAIQILGNTDDAKDAVQQSLSKVLTQKNIPQQEHELNLWFKRIVRNTAIDTLRSTKRKHNQKTLLKQHQEIQNQLKPCRDVVEDKQQKEILNQCLQKLSKEHREIIVLRDYHSHSYEEISTILGLAKGTIMSRLHRARLALRTILKELPEGDL